VTDDQETGQQIKKNEQKRRNEKKGNKYRTRTKARQEE